MKLRKTNAVVSLLCTALLFYHAVSYGVWMIAKGPRPSITAPSYALLALMLLHAVLSIVMAFLGHRGSDKGKYRVYPKENRVTLFQRYGGVLLLLLTALHVFFVPFLFSAGLPLFLFVHVAFFLVAFAHTGVSVSKAFITLGIGNARTIFIVDLLAKLFSGAAAVFTVVALLFDLFGGNFV